MIKIKRRSENAAPSQEQLIALAREDFFAFVVLMFPLLHGGQAMKSAPYIEWVCHVLTRRGSREGGRLIFNMPPGYMKSLLISVLYVAWRLGVNPSERFICASYADELAYKFARQTRQVMQSPRYLAMFPATVLTKAAEDSLETSRGGSRLATKVGGLIGGFRANVIIIDDPMQPDDSYNAGQKQKLVEWYDGVVGQRLQTGGAILVVMHRLAPDDFCATLEEKGGWEVVKLPLIAEERGVFSDHRKRVIWAREPGDLLNPNYRDAAEVQRQKRELRSDIWDAQCQQRPRFGGSGMCSIDRLARYSKAPQFECTVHSWDLAATKGGGDWTVCAQFGLARNQQDVDLLYLIEILRMRVELPDVRAIIAEQDKFKMPALIIIDANGIGQGVYQDLERSGLKHLNTAGGLTTAKTGHRKIQLFHLTLPNLYDGRILIPETMPGLAGFLEEIAAFPDGKYDDQVDALTIVGAYRDRVVAEARRNAERYGRWTRDHRDALERGRPLEGPPPPRSRYMSRYD